MKKTKVLLVIALFSSSFFFACKKEDKGTTTPDYKNLILGKWLWYKTITTGSQGSPYDTFYNQGMFKEFLANGKVITTDGNGQVYNDNYFISGNKLAQTHNNGSDTTYSDITACSAAAFSIYDKVTYTYVNPPAVVEYWNYFIK